jgi:hypothetical protein
MDLLAIPASLLTKAGIKNPKPVIYGALVIVAGIVILSIIKRARQNADRKAKERMQSGLLLPKGGTSTSDITISESDITISEGEAILIAQNLLNAMDRWGTDIEAIKDNLNRCKTNGDLNLVMQRFGIKPYFGFGLADTVTRKQMASMKNLTEWLKAELSGRDMQKVKDIYSTLNVPF